MNLIVVIETNKDATTLFQGCLLFISLSRRHRMDSPKIHAVPSAFSKRKSRGCCRAIDDQPMAEGGTYLIAISFGRAASAIFGI